MGNKIKLVVVSLLIFFIFINGTQANSLYEGKVIKKVEIEGNKQVTKGNILDIIKSKTGRKFSRGILKEDVKKLYASGYFSDINIDLSLEEGLKLTFYVVERPIISTLAIKGNKSFKDTKIKEIITVKEGEIFKEIDLKKDVFKIEEYYQKKGYYLIEVKTQLTLEEEENKLALTFLIKEGKRMRIKEIKIEGNQAFSNKQIRRRMETRKFYYADTFNEDKEKICNLYHNNGYLKVQVSAPKITFDEKKGRIYLEFTIEEGAQFKIGKIGMEGNTVFSSLTIKEGMETKEGEVFSKAKFERDYLRNMPLRYEEKGYISMRVFPQMKVEEENKTIDIFLNIQEGEISHIEEIRLEGNTKTKEKVIKRELTFYEGDIFNTKKLLRSMQKIYNLGFFEKVEKEILPGKEKGGVILIISVEEQRTGLATFGGGYSSLDGFVGYLQYKEINLLGKGQQLSSEWQFGGTLQNYRLSFTEPWFLDTPTSLGFDVYDTTRDREYYTSQKRGGGIRWGRTLKAFNKIYLKYKYEDVDISDVEEEAPDIIKDQEGKYATSSLTPSFIRDTRVNRFDPQKGYRGDISCEYAGGFLGGDNDFYKPVIEASLYLPSWWKFVFGLRIKTGIVESFKDTETPPIYEYFYVGGGDTVRGYPESKYGKNSLGPLEGGKSMLILNAEYKFPLSRNLGFAFFIDAGNSWEEINEIDFKDLAVGYGIGVRIRTPIMPIRLDYGYGLERGEGEIHFSMGSFF